MRKKLSNRVEDLPALGGWRPLMMVFIDIGKQPKKIKQTNYIHQMKIKSKIHIKIFHKFN